MQNQKLLNDCLQNENQAILCRVKSSKRFMCKNDSYFLAELKLLKLLSAKWVLGYFMQTSKNTKDFM